MIQGELMSLFCIMFTRYVWYLTQMTSLCYPYRKNTILCCRLKYWQFISRKRFLHITNQVNIGLMLSEWRGDRISETIYATIYCYRNTVLVLSYYKASAILRWP